MGSHIEINDTLQLTTAQGFPEDILNLEKHRTTPIQLGDVVDQIFEFQNKPGARIYHLSPIRCFLVHNINGKWVYWGKVLILEQTIKNISKDEQVTSGKYKIIDINDPVYQEMMTKNESPVGLSFF